MFSPAHGRCTSLHSLHNTLLTTPLNSLLNPCSHLHTEGVRPGSESHETRMRHGAVLGVPRNAPRLRLLKVVDRQATDDERTARVECDLVVRLNHGPLPQDDRYTQVRRVGHILTSHRVPEKEGEKEGEEEGEEEGGRRMYTTCVSTYMRHTSHTAQHTAHHTSHTQHTQHAG